MWYGCYLSVKIDETGVTSFERWFCKLFLHDSPLDDYGKLHVANLCYNLWKLRSASIFSGAVTDPFSMVSTTNATAAEFWSANQDNEPAVAFKDSVPHVSLPPTLDEIKVNCDGSYLQSSGNAGIGIIWRNHPGIFIKGWCERVTDNSGLMAKIIACQKAVSLMQSDYHRHNVIEIDCQDFYKALSFKSCVNCNWLYHGMIADLIKSVECYPFLHLSLVRR